MGLAGKLAKKAGKAAGTAVVKKINGGCPGSRDGKHRYTSQTMREPSTTVRETVKDKKGNIKVVKRTIPGKKGATVTYCVNRGCGKMP